MNSKCYLYENGYFLHIEYDDDMLGIYLDNEYASERELDVKDIFNDIVSVTDEVKYLKITIVNGEDIVSILQVRNNKIIRYNNYIMVDKTMVEVFYTTRKGMRINIPKVSQCDSNLVIDSIKVEMDMLLGYQNSKKDVKTLKKTNDKIEKM